MCGSDKHYATTMQEKKKMVRNYVCKLIELFPIDRHVQLW